MDPDSRFDLLGLNSLSMADLVHEAQMAGHETVRALSKTAELLLPRVRKETGLRDEVAQLLRVVAERWYRASAVNPTPPARSPWRTWASVALGGLFYESRIPGGSRTPRLADRLQWASEGLEGPHATRWHLLFGGNPDSDISPTLHGRPPDEVFLLRAAQAILDDLADSSRGSSPDVVLPRLTDLAGSTSARDVNAALQSMFPTYEQDSFLLLDPIRNPGITLCTLRWPSERANTQGSAYQVTVAPPPDSSSGDPGSVAAGAPPGSPMFYLPKWYGPSRTRPEWIDILRSMSEKQTRFPPPPSADCRENEGYRSLRSALVGGSPATELFDQVCWKGRPRDLPLLNQLLKDGSYVPEEETDSGYLEAELNELVSGDPRQGGDGGLWKLDRGKTVRRELGPDGTPKYLVVADAPATV
jgi:hypothetical protein